MKYIDENDTDKLLYSLIYSKTLRLYNGYLQFFEKESSSWVFVHRKVAEIMTGSPILKGYEVHHINHDKLDNRPENLEILTEDEHHAIHRRVTINDVYIPGICPRCNGRGYLPHYQHVQNGICFLCWGKGNYLYRRIAAPIERRISRPITSVTSQHPWSTDSRNEKSEEVDRRFGEDEIIVSKLDSNTHTYLNKRNNINNVWLLVEPFSIEASRNWINYKIRIPKNLISETDMQLGLDSKLLNYLKKGNIHFYKLNSLREEERIKFIISMSNTNEWTYFSAHTKMFTFTVVVFGIY